VSGDDNPRWVSTSRAQAVQREIGAKMYMECSSLRMEGVDEIFEQATRQAMLVRSASQGANHHHQGSGAGGVGGGANGLAEKGDRRKSTILQSGDGGASAGGKPADHSKGCCVIL
jgi:Rho family protein